MSGRRIDSLAGRFVVLSMTRSFYGNEDHGLTDKLLLELPGILQWAIKGWQRLKARGHFLQPDSSKEAIEELEDLACSCQRYPTESSPLGKMG